MLASAVNLLRHAPLLLESGRGEGEPCSLFAIPPITLSPSTLMDPTWISSSLAPLGVSGGFTT